MQCPDTVKETSMVCNKFKEPASEHDRDYHLNSLVYKKTKSKYSICIISFSLVEIYNERVLDLLTASDPGRSLRVREHPHTGPYVDGEILI